jgi:hypothetical protein
MLAIESIWPKDLFAPCNGKLGVYHAPPASNHREDLTGGRTLGARAASICAVLERG